MKKFILTLSMVMLFPIFVYASHFSLPKYNISFNYPNDLYVTGNDFINHYLVLESNINGSVTDYYSEVAFTLLIDQSPKKVATIMQSHPDELLGYMENDLMDKRPDCWIEESSMKTLNGKNCYYVK